ncbi:MAG TPA: tetratricopeptide repeat protein [Edaphocola sp.]|nr:tetratricopeptide repeat protein [Edaphocola sp.]
MNKDKVIFSLLTILGLVLLSRFSALNKPHSFNYNFEAYAPQNEPDTNKKIVVSAPHLKPGSKEFKDSMIQARKLYVDSLKAAQEAQRDSLTKERKRLTDSINVERQRIADSTSQALKKYNDSLKLALETQRAERKQFLDSIRAVQQAKRDSLEIIRRYRNSRVYKDSVAQVKKERLDSIAKARQQRADSMAKERQKIKDSLAVKRKHLQDSLEQVRKHTQDSLAQSRKQLQDSLQNAIAQQRAKNKLVKDSLDAIRKIRTDSIAKVKAEREALAEKKIKDRIKEKNAKGRQKEKEEREAYTNEKMRKKSWNFLRKTYHNTTTHFNYYFNGNERLVTIEKNMLKNAGNQYEKLLPLFPFNPDVDSSKYAADLDSLIRKASVGVQIHDPRSKWQDDLYFLIGKSYYYKGDYKNAAAAFKFIIANAEQEKQEKAKTKKDKKAIEALGSLADKESRGIFQHNSAKNDAGIWLAIVLAQDSAYNLSQTVLNMLHSSKFYNPNIMEGRFGMGQGFLDLKSGNNIAAIQSLKLLYEDNNSPNWLRQRAAFIVGQLLNKEGAYAGSDSAFQKVIDLNPNFEMEFYARLNIIENNIAGGMIEGNQLHSQLSKMSKELKFKDYYDKIYFAQAQVYEQQNNSLEALSSYKKSIAVNTKNTIQKGLSFAGMANLYYIENKYTEAKTNYDSALMFLTPQEQPLFEIASRRAGALNYIAEPGAIVAYTDSILTLSEKTEKEQKDVVKKYLKELEKHLLDSLYAAKNAIAASAAALPPPMALSGGKNSWYFGNTNTVQKGVNTFKQKWGNRTLKDNWNRSDLSSSVAGGTTGGENNEELSEEDQLRATMPTEAELLAMIPKGKNELDSANKVLEENLYQLGIGYYKHMDDMPQAIKTFDILDSRYPNHPYGAEINYYRYLIALNNNEPEKAQKYLEILRSQFGQTTWAKLAIPNTQGQPTTGGLSIADHYSATYAALMNQQFNQAIIDANAAPTIFPNEIKPYLNKYKLVAYAAMVGLSQYKDADSALSKFIAENPNDETIPWAKELQKLIKGELTAQAAKPVGSSSSNDPLVLANGPSQSFVFTPKSLHYVLVYSKIDNDNRLMGVRAGLQELNKTNASFKDMSVSMTQLTAQQNLVAIGEFNDMEAAKKYMSFIKKEKKVFQAFSSPTDYEIIMISNDNIIKLYTEKNMGDYLNFYKSKY